MPTLLELATQFFLQMLVILVAYRLIWPLFKRLAQVQVVAIMVAGFVLGPSVLGLLWPDGQQWLFPTTVEVGGTEHMKHRYAFAPFGGGAHNCIGKVFAQMEVKTVVHRLLLRYRLELPHAGYRPRWDYGGMPIPLDGMPIVLQPL